MRSVLVRFIRDDEGQDLIEYGLPLGALGAFLGYTLGLGLFGAALVELAGEVLPGLLGQRVRRLCLGRPQQGGRLHAVPIAWKGGATFPVRAYVQFGGESG